MKPTLENSVKIPNLQLETIYHTFIYHKQGQTEKKPWLQWIQPVVCNFSSKQEFPKIEMIIHHYKITSDHVSSLESVAAVCYCISYLFFICCFVHIPNQLFSHLNCMHIIMFGPLSLSYALKVLLIVEGLILTYRYLYVILPQVDRCLIHLLIL